jgi:diguanylate cyclase (GGDEF)-like protein/putative nucleotidyltransferase with HDIG domain
MKDLSASTKLYLYTTYMAGITFFVWHISRINLDHLLMLVILCVLASLTLILKVEGATNRSHYTFSFLIYGFTFALYGIPEAMLVIVISNAAEWIWNRPAWYIQLFNTSGYIVVMQAAGIVYTLINPNQVSISWQAVLAIAASMATFNILNHAMVGIVVWLARGENFQKSGVMDFFPIMLDLTLLYFGASLSFVWAYNQFALALFSIPIYLIYSTLRVPALERQTETDNKTGLFNHGYFKQQFDNELERANRFDRPVSIIMADLDLLRNINNTYGHLAGDEVLVGIAKLLKQSVRDYDVAARFGGEEFAILLPETPIQQAYERAEYIRKVVEGAEFIIPTSVFPIRVTMSFGISCRENFGQTTDEIVHNADTALYHSKLNGRNQASAYANDAYINFLNDGNKNMPPHHSWTQQPPSLGHPIAEVPSQVVPINTSKPSDMNPPTKSVDTLDSHPSDLKTKPKNSKFPINFYIGSMALVSLLSFVALYQASIPLQHLDSFSGWISLLVISVLIAMAELFSVNLYFRQTSVSTSAIPILVGYLLFGPIGILVVSLTVAFVLFVKHRSPVSRFIFNFSNHLLAGTLCTFLIVGTGKNFLMWNPLGQLMLSLMSAIVLYLTSTWLIAVGMSLDLKQPARQIWKEQYSWLALYYIGIGLIAYTLVFGYKYDEVTGIILMVVPMAFLRLSQTQYINRTRASAMELREKNQILKKNSEEIAELNEGLLETLSEVIDLRDPYVLGHSKQVSNYATQIARIMKLNEKQIELIRKGALLHDIGKLGIPEELLAKPSRLTSGEYEVMKRHAVLGAELVGKSPSLRALVPIIRQHHEFFNGNGYPDRLKGNQIGIEARIVAIADAIEAMSSDRPYRKSLKLPRVIDEIKQYAGTQFDPMIVDAAVRMLERQMEATESQPENQPEFMRTFAADLPTS